MSYQPTTRAGARRQSFQKGSNNPDNPNQNICVQAVAFALGVDYRVRYLHTIKDLVRAARLAYTVRSRKSAVGNAKTVGAIRNKVKDLGASYYILRVAGHVLLLGSDGKTLVDTDPRKRDKRKVTHIYGVFA
tara:strand:- start:99 stop:494 length:396 start_codon:yes stop_codon:yes gene_type:complete